MKLRIALIVASLIILPTIGYIFFTYNNFFADQEREVEQLQDDEKIELVFWRNGGNPAFNEAYEQLVAAFEEKHPHIVINMHAEHWAHEYELRLRTELAAGNHPDILTIDSPNLGLYANAGALLSLDKYMKNEGNIEDILEPTLVGLTYQGEIYLAPIIESSIALYYNKHLFKKFGIPFPAKDPDNPLTWEEILQIALQINDHQKGIIGIDPAQGFGEGEGPAYFKMPILWQFGANVLSPDGTTAKGYLNSPEALEALQFYQDLYHKHQVSALELPPGAFETNQLAMTVLGSWHLLELQRFADFKLGEDFGVAPLPRSQYQVAPNGGWALGISAKTDYPDEAWEFIKFITSYEGSKKFAEITGEIPARYSVTKDLPELNEYPKNIFVRQGQKYSRNRPVTPAYSVVSEAVKTLFEEVGLAGRDVKEAADDAVEKINNALNHINQ